MSYTVGRRAHGLQSRDRNGGGRVIVFPGGPPSHKVGTYIFAETDTE